MISAIIPTRNAQPYLTRALAPLVAGVAAGLIKEAVVADGGSQDDTVAMAEEAGCTLVRAAPDRAARLMAGVGAARGDWLLALDPRAALAPDWLAQTERFLTRSDADRRAACFRLESEDGAVFWAKLRARFSAAPHVAQGLLISRRLFVELGGYRPEARDADADLARRLGARRITLLNAGAVLAAGALHRVA